MLNILINFFSVDMYGYSIRQKAVVKKMMKFPFKDTILLHMKFLNSDMRGAVCTEDGKLNIIFL